MTIWTRFILQVQFPIQVPGTVEHHPTEIVIPYFSGSEEKYYLFTLAMVFIIGILIFLY